jgi:hypothetical protein
MLIKTVYKNETFDDNDMLTKRTYYENETHIKIELNGSVFIDIHTVTYELSSTSTD